MSDIRKLMRAVDAGEPVAGDELLPLVYDELRALAKHRLAGENRVVSPSATSLVHEVYFRVVGPDKQARFANHRQFFAAGAEAMRRILIDRARQRATVKHGGGKKRIDLDLLVLSDPTQINAPDELIALSDAIDELASHDEMAAELVKLRFFAGFQHGETAEVLGITRRAADRLWVIARTWLYERLSHDDSEDSDVSSLPNR